MEYLAQIITTMRSEEGEPAESEPADAEPLLRADDLANSYSSPAAAAGAQPEATQSWFSYIGCVLGLIAEPTAEDWVIDYNSITHIKWLGSGANGAVFLGAHAGKAVAVKKLEHSEQLKREVNHLRGLCHPNIIKLLGICVQPNTCAVVMEFCPESLTDAIHKHDDAIIPPTTVVDWSTQIARGMEYLHAMNIIHRDLKVHTELLDTTYNQALLRFTVPTTACQCAQVRRSAQDHRLWHVAGVQGPLHPHVLCGDGSLHGARSCEERAIL